MAKSRQTKPLGEYQAKRKFTQTPEPAGKLIRPKGPLVFVVHKHAASHLHFDLRLEMGGVYKSWAVPKGPTLNPSEQRLAVRVEDHPMEYGKFEGIIPEGNYGAGTVMIWDRGTLQSRADIDRKKSDRKASEKELLAGYDEGHITFVLQGEKLKGEFALVRIKKGDAKTWLLVKKRDSFASSKTLLADRSVTTGRTMPEIAAEAQGEGKVWSSGKKVKPVPKPTAKPAAKPSARAPVGQSARAERSSAYTPFPRRVKLMQGVLLMKAPEGDFVYLPSWNAIRAIAEIEKRKAALYSKSFLPLGKRHPAALAAVSKITSDIVLDGEIHEERFYATDLLYAEGTDYRTSPVEKRLAALEKLDLPTKVIKLPAFTDSAIALAAAKKLGADFLIAKKLGTPYESGLSKNWARFQTAGNNQDPALEAPPLTHLDKTYFPDDKFTKGDIVSYYDSIAELILPYLIDRPQSMHRQPDGIRNAGFFHKDQSGYLPRRVKTFRVNSASSGKTVNYLLCQDRWTLLYMVNLGCIELNPWLSRAPELDRPDYLVIDLDPDTNSFDEVVEVARAFKKVLNEIGAESFCKTSGASGMHICVPTQAKFDFDECRVFAEDVCKVVAAQFRKNTSLERTPAKRRGKIYLDYLQNRRGQTLAAPYCVRPHPGAPVSTPLKWSEVKPGLSPSDFTIQTIRKRVKSVGDLWKPMLSVKVDLAKCRKRLNKILPGK